MFYNKLVHFKHSGLIPFCR